MWRVGNNELTRTSKHKQGSLRPRASRISRRAAHDRSNARTDYERAAIAAVNDPLIALAQGPAGPISAETAGEAVGNKKALRRRLRGPISGNMPVNRGCLCGPALTATSPSFIAADERRDFSQSVGRSPIRPCFLFLKTGVGGATSADRL